MPTCKMCEKPIVGRGLCRRHYERAWRRGEHKRHPTKDRGTLRERFMTKFRADPTGCWVWVGHRNSMGYAMIWHNNKAVRAHRVAYALFIGRLTNKHVVCHICDNPLCVNPKHLFRGTRLDNNRDCAKKGRRPKGEDHWNARLSEADIKKIRTSPKPQWVLAKEFGVSQSHISRLKSGSRGYWAPS